MFYFDLDSGNISEELQNRTHTSGIEIKRGNFPTQVIFHKGQIPRILTGSAPEVKAVLKTDGEFDQDPPLASVTGFTAPTDDVETPYSATLAADGAAIRSLLKVNGDPSDDEKTAPAMLEILYRPNSTAVWVPSKTIPVTLTNRVSQDDEAAPAPAVVRTILYSPEITGLTGGGSSKLDGVPSVSLTLNQLRLVLIPGQISFYELVAGTDAESSPLVIRPDDYDGATNQKIWRRVDLNLGYKIYRATLSQSGTGAPVATVLQNTLGGTVVWSRFQPGGYTGTLAGAFPAGKTWIMLAGGSDQDSSQNTGINAPNSVDVLTSTGSAGSDELLSETAIEILVYP